MAHRQTIVRQLQDQSGCEDGNAMLGNCNREPTSQPSVDEQAPPTLMRQLRINEAHILKTQTSQSPRYDRLYDPSQWSHLNPVHSNQTIRISH
jgi:hypothetical protein